MQSEKLNTVDIQGLHNFKRKEENLRSRFI